MDDKDKKLYEDYIKLLKENNLGEIELTEWTGEQCRTVIFRAKK